MEDLSRDRLDDLVDTDPIQLRDIAVSLAAANERLKEELDAAHKSVGYLSATLTAIRDIAYRAMTGDAAKDALEAIHQRASRAVGNGGNS